MVGKRHTHYGFAVLLKGGKGAWRTQIKESQGNQFHFAEFLLCLGSFSFNVQWILKNRWSNLESVVSTYQE